MNRSAEVSMNRAEEYGRLTDECCKVAGPGDWYWNERFVSALQKRGLTLATARHPNDLDAWYPTGYPAQAPIPFHIGPHSWPVGALVVWARNEREFNAQAQLGQ